MFGMDPQNRTVQSTTSPSENPPTVEISPLSYPLRSAAAHQPRTDSPGLRSLKSVDSIPSTGILPLGSLRIHEIDDNSDMELATPLTIPEGAPEANVQKGAGLLRGGDVLILDDLPANFTVGCDTVSFTTSQQFLGFRDIPPGAHLIWVAPSESTSSRSAYWIVTHEKEVPGLGTVYVKQWDKFNEVLSDPATQAEERFQKERLEQIFSNLFSYHFRASTSALAQTGRASSAEQLPPFLGNTTIWSRLTCGIQPALLDRITGKSQGTWPVTTSDRVAGETSSEEALLYATTSSQLKFTFPVDKHVFDTTAKGAERTQQALDPTSWVLSEIQRVSDSHIDNDIIGELQFAFLTGMHLGNYSCLEQWWHYATRIVFRAYRLIVERPRLARELIQTFHAQLVYNDRNLEGDVMETMPSNAKKLRRQLTVYKARLNETLLALGDKCTPDQKAVGAAFEGLEAWLWRLGWDLRGEYVRSGNVMLEDGEMVQVDLSDFESEDERGDFAAVVVDLDDNGRPMNFVSV